MKAIVRAVIVILMIFIVSCESSVPSPDGTVESNKSFQEKPMVSSADQTSCTGDLTSSNQEGPYYSPGSPEKASLVEPGMAGDVVLIRGAVFNQDCVHLIGAKVDFWQADADGIYDNSGYRLRGHVFTGEDGAYAIETIVPGLYTGRPPHIHVKVFASDGRELLTSQLYFPGSEDSADIRNAPDLLVALQGQEDGPLVVNFNFIVQE